MSFNALELKALEAAGPMDLSSAEEEKIRRTREKKKNWQQGLVTNETIRAQIPATFPSSITQTADVDIPLMLHFEDLLKEYPYLEDQKITCGHIQAKKAAAASSSSSSSNSYLTSTSTTSDSMKEEVTSEPAMVPDSPEKKIISSYTQHLEVLEQRAKFIPEPVFYVMGQYGARVSQSDFTAPLKNGQVSLPLLHADVMQSLLQEAGVFQPPILPHGETRNFPACMNGDMCIGNRGLYAWVGDSPSRYRGRTGIIFRQLVYPNEMQALVADSRAPPPRPCVACCTLVLVEYVNCDRAMLMNCDEYAKREGRFEDGGDTEVSSSSNSSTNPHGLLNVLYGRSAPEQRILQLFRVPIDCPNGFYKHYTLCDPSAYDVYIDPILELNASTAFLRYNAEIDRVYLDIELLKWKPKVLDEPRTGENLGNF